MGTILKYCVWVLHRDRNANTKTPKPPKPQNPVDSDLFCNLLYTMMKKAMCLLGSLMMATEVQAQKAYVDDDSDIASAKLAMNRAKPAATVDVTGAQRVAFKTKHTPLLDTFRGTTGKVVGDGIWKERGVATLKYD